MCYYMLSHLSHIYYTRICSFARTSTTHTHTHSLFNVGSFVRSTGRETSHALSTSCDGATTTLYMRPYSSSFAIMPPRCTPSTTMLHARRRNACLFFFVSFVCGGAPDDGIEWQNDERQLMTARALARNSCKTIMLFYVFCCSISMFVLGWKIICWLV